MAPTPTDASRSPAWREREREREYTDEVIGDDTLGRMFEASAERNAARPAQRYKGGVYDRSLAATDALDAAPRGEYATLTYAEMRDVVRHLAAGFRDLGVAAGDRVGIFADTRMEWAQADFAVLQAGGVVTTVYAESSPRQVRYLLDDPGATGVVVENAELLERVLAVEDDLDLSFVVVVDETDTGDREDLLTLGELHERGRERFDPADHEARLDAVSPDDLASLIYTSGTTGEPKGVELTHANLRANVNQNRKRMGPRPDRPDSAPALDADTETMSFLPLAHVFERTAGHFLPFASGACVGYAESSDTVAEDIRTLSPNVVTSVPRVYERIYDAMREQAGESALKRRIFEWAVGVGREYDRAAAPGPTLEAKYRVADRLVFASVRRKMGGNVDFFVSGGGSLSKELSELFNGMGLTILEGYGLTETAPVVSVNPLGDVRPGTLGVPLVDIDVRIDGSALSDDPTEGADGDVGELQVRGPNVTPGYWNRPDATDEAFTDDGFFRTGDVVEQTDDGYLVFHERLKEILVLDTGKNVAPGPIEDAFATSDRIDQVMVAGDGEKFVSAIIVPNFEAVRRWADRQDVELPRERAAVCEHQQVRAYVGRVVRRVNENLEKEQRIKRFVLVPDEWTAENDMMTPSMKKKRRNIRRRYGDELDDIYGRELSTTVD